MSSSASDNGTNGMNGNDPPPSSSSSSSSNHQGPKAGTGLVLSLGGGGGAKKGGGGGGAKKGGGGGFKRPAPIERKAVGGFGGHDDHDEEESKSEFITSLDREDKAKKEEKAPMVISVPIPKWLKEKEKKEKEEAEKRDEGEGAGEGGEPASKKQKTLDDLAAEALAKEARRGEGAEDDDGFGGGKNGRVIEIKAPLHQRDDLGEDAPMLVKNAVPVPKDITDDKARLQYELSLREDDIDSSSDVYKTVPVEEFGAALLRGMGWKGPSEDDIKVFQVKPRPQGLGLGANPAALELDPQGSWKSKKKRGGGMNKEEALKAKEALAKAAQEKIRTQKLKDGDVVRIMSGEYGGLRAMVSQADGVAGIMMIEVELEEGSKGGTTTVRIKSTDAFKVSDSELKDKPFAGGKRRETVNGGGGGGSVKKRSRSRSASRSRSTDRESKKRKKSEKKEKKKKKSERSRSRSQQKKKSSSSSKRSDDDRGNCSSSAPPTSSWLIPHIRIRIVTERALGGGGGGGGKSYFRAKGVVVDVPRAEEAIIQLDSGPILEGVKAKHLETALPGVGGAVLILRGPHRLQKARLLETDSRKEEGVVQLTEDLSVLRMSLDDIAEYKGRAGAGGEDDDDDMGI